jgi:hypothetical protein
MVSNYNTTTTNQSRLYTTTKWVILAFFLYWELGFTPLVVLKIFNLEKKIYEKKNTSLEPRQVPGLHGPLVLHEGARGGHLWHLTQGVRKEDINLLNILLLLLLLRNLLPQQHATSSIPSRSVTQSFPAGVWKSVSNLYPLSCCCRHVDCSISYLPIPR